MRFLVLLALAALFAVATAQVSVTPSVTNTNTNSGTNSNTNSNTGSWTKSGSNSWTATQSWTQSASHSGTGTGSATVTYPTPAAPTGLVDGCPGAIEVICLAWSEPAGFSYDLYRVYFQAAGSTFINSTVATDTQVRVGGPGLIPATTYTLWVSGVDSSIGVWSANSSTIQITTAAADPKYDPSLDASNFACERVINPANNRVGVNCTWTAAKVTVKHINLKGRCVSDIRKPLLVRKRLWGTKANRTWALFAVNRDQATCNFYAKFYYERRPTTRRHFKLVL